MTPLTSLWLPILLAAVFVFIASSILHMLLPFHRADHRKLPSEGEVMDALRRFNIPPGDYMMPSPGGPEAMRSPAFIEKLATGPVAVMTFMKPGPPALGINLAQWFAYCVVVGIIAAYVAGRALPPGADYLGVFRFTGAVSFTAYAVALWQDSIWYSRAWKTTVKNSVDGLIYGLLTAGAFGWLWPNG